MNGKIQAIWDKKLPKQRSLKIGDVWYGVWLQDQEGKDTDLHWIVNCKEGDILPEFEVKDSPDGKYHNIVSAKAPIINVDRGGEAQKSEPKPGALNYTQLDTCLMCAKDLTVALVNSGKVGIAEAELFLISDFRMLCDAMRKE